MPSTIGGATHGTGAVTIHVLRNDTDIDDDPLTDHLVRRPWRSGPLRPGRLHLHAVGEPTYTDEFTYTVGDGHGGTARATVFIRVFENGAPTAENDTAVAHGTASQSIDVLFNDRDPDGDKLTAVPVSPFAAHGQVSCGDDVLLHP